MKTAFVTLSAVPLVTLFCSYSGHCQTTAFTYQGQLNFNGSPATQQQDMLFYLRDALTGGNPVGSTNFFDGIAHSPNPVNPAVSPDKNGVFTALLDFGSQPFTGPRLWLQIETRPHATGSYVPQAPRTELTPAPYAITAAHLVSGGLAAGTYGNAVVLNNPANSFTGNGSGLTGLNASSISGALGDGQLSANVALLNRPQQSFTGNNSFGNVTISPPSILSFGAGTRQMVNLWGSAYGIGVQNYTHYVRTDAGGSFAWYEAGVHSDTREDPGAGGATLMMLSSSGGLNLARGASLFSGLAMDDLWVGSRPQSDATSSYFLRARARLQLRNGTIVVEPVFLVRGDRRVGIGTEFPDSLLHANAGLGSSNAVHGSCSDPAGSGVVGSHSAQGRGVAGISSGAGIGVYGENTDSGGWAGFFNGPVFLGEGLSWGTSSLSTDVNGGIELGNSALTNITPYIDFHFGVNHTQDFNVRLINDVDGQLTCVGHFWATGDSSCRSVTIRGGADLAEPFELSGQEAPKGSLVVIDEEHAGKVKLATEEYDKRVAGIVSGANGVNPGISLHQEGTLDGGQNVALSGRVYALADASFGSIKPGDLLTSSSTPGHVMKVTDHPRAQGAIVGKAMSGLKQGKGMVLVLVTLQ